MILITLETNNILTIHQLTEVSNGACEIPSHHHDNNNIDTEVIERARLLFNPFSLVGEITGLSSFVKLHFVALAACSALFKSSQFLSSIKFEHKSSNVTSIFKVAKACDLINFGSPITLKVGFI
ncbi:hypothetical protein EB796_018331 [Bugula neritina]|uniref:Uncharacterized protein n=1 Tax=Bugula neritina TaxID=10212 RepID=A0A7J7JAT3_BUGNE|nr:hypothetical protein EB796_018331 [Bugula neritina]